MTAPTELRLPGRHTIRVGDLVRVAGTVLEGAGVRVADRGWSGARVLRFLPHPSGAMLVEVTVPNRAGTRTVQAERLTRTRQGGPR